MVISSEGNITLPLIGKVRVAGLGVIEAERKLAEIVDADYLIDPEVVIELKRARKKEATDTVSVLGAVRSPGNYEIVTRGKRTTLVQAILQAGGFSDVANIRKLKVIRKGNGQNQVIRVNAENIISGKESDIELQPEDIIHVSESLF